MKKRTLLILAILTLSFATSSAFAAEGQGEQSKNAGVGGKHNFDQWQTIKRLQITN
ncbi:hypothetical protein JJB07_11655 [Tumebacillus sp. ITR2]|uniref:Uncharacterized protein n=1 Tax=Tumebacillus amylolyticus TaxID=2801339 RepID=A0ABS1JAJ4_9BACL|nr:hypothetical protein [Tumebacillus amylolyticus]MBL0387307.1 hypothetical protein [Tumebacillus amylolyticus]